MIKTTTIYIVYRDNSCDYDTRPIAVKAFDKRKAAEEYIQSVKKNILPEDDFYKIFSDVRTKPYSIENNGNFDTKKYLLDKYNISLEDYTSSIEAYIEKKDYFYFIEKIEYQYNK